MTQTTYIVGNWKMHGDSTSTVELLTGITSAFPATSAAVMVCPPNVFLQTALTQLNDHAVSVGAQNVCAQEQNQGAYTGEVSASMLKGLGCSAVIVGHSERRQYYGETNELVAQKTMQVLQTNMLPIVCIGESLEQREANKTFEVLEQQLRCVLDSVLEQTQSAEIIIAYEPVWAIGTGLSASPEQAQEVHAFLRSILQEYSAELAAKTSILYGGSVKPDNAKALLAQQDINGALIGGASLKSEQFIQIVEAV